MSDLLSSYHILIVDDIQADIFELRKILEPTGYHIDTVPDGQIAIEVAKKTHPHLILLDSHIRERDGLEVLKDLKSTAETHEIPVILMAPLEEKGKFNQGYRLGAVEYVSKPFQTEELIHRVANRYELYQHEKSRSELTRLLETKENVYSLITRELRSPISSIKMLNHSLLHLIEKEAVGEETYEMLLTVHKKTEEAALLLDNLMKISQLQQKVKKPYRQFVDVNGVINCVVDNYSPVSELRHITFVRESLQGELMGFIDVDMIKTVVRNLLSNALKFTPDAGCIYIITAQTDKEEIVCSIRDTGVGIRERDRERIWSNERFATRDLEQNTGAGLGLKICRQYIESHEGRIWFDSVEKQGSTFSFSVKNINP